MAAVELTATRDHLVCLAAKSAEAKTASFLLALSRRNAAVGEDPNEIRLPMTRLDIADYLGLTLETVAGCSASSSARALSTCLAPRSSASGMPARLPRLIDG